MPMLEHKKIPDAKRPMVDITRLDMTSTIAKRMPISPHSILDNQSGGIIQYRGIDGQE